MDEMLSPTTAEPSSDAPLDDQRRAVAAFKKTALMVLGTAMQTYREKVADEQEVLTWAADILIDTYAAESAVLRAGRASLGRAPAAELHVDAARVYVNDATFRVEAAARQALAAMTAGDSLRTLLAALRRVLKVSPINTVAPRRRLADATLTKGGYLF
jgi:hypothetical protein